MTSLPLPSTTGSQSISFLLTTPWQRGWMCFFRSGTVWRLMPFLHSPYLSGPQQAPFLQGNSADSHSPSLGTEGVVTGASESLSGSSGAPFLHDEIFSDSPISIICIRTSMCFGFMRDDYPAIRSPPKAVLRSGTPAFSVPLFFLSLPLSTSLGMLWGLVCQSGEFCFLFFDIQDHRLFITSLC